MNEFSEGIFRVIGAEEVKNERKVNDLKRKIQEIEKENDLLTVKLGKSRNEILRLRLERK